ncbi:MAG: hypothetical protein RJA44_1781 [Pseudomonadota bacterium]|jgi:hypothetical protein
MGLLGGLMGIASETDANKIEREFAQLLVEGESVDKAYKLVRDVIIFTNRRLVLVDKQGLTGSKKEYLSLPYRSVVRFSVETQGHFDVESELKIWVSGSETPISREFRGDGSILDIQRTLAACVCR